MADRRSDSDKGEPTLELPKLFGRKRRGTEAPEPAAERTVEPSPSQAPSRHDEPAAPQEPAAPVDEPGARKAARTTPVLPPRLAAVITGLLVGVAGTLLTYGSLRGCEALTGTGSCGGGPWLLLLVAILAVMVLLGGLLLKAWSVTDPQSTSFLAVAITAVVVMLTMLEAVFSVWIFLAVPLVCMAAYVAAHWVTTRFADTEPESRGVDVR